MEIILDGQDWQTEADLIEAVIAAVEGPSWHGRNYNALHDSLVVGSINGVAPPYDFVIKAPALQRVAANDAISYFVARVTEWRTDGANVSVRVEH